MSNIKNIQDLKGQYHQGIRYFRELNFENGEDLRSTDFSDSIFEHCSLSVNFSNANLQNVKFLNCNIQGTDFSNTNLINSQIENCQIDDVLFNNAQLEDINIIGNTIAGKEVKLSNGEIIRLISPLVEELYSDIPEFASISDRRDDELEYTVYGQLSLVLYDNIMQNNEVTDFTKKCFNFFNKIDDRQDNSIDNLLIVGIYEGLYSKKKCNDIARGLLKGRNKDVYEYWMINGIIRSEY